MNLETSNYSEHFGGKHKVMRDLKKKITVVLPVEVKSREFDSRLLLAYHLIKEGYRVIIGDRSGCSREILFIQNCIYLGKSLAFSQSELFEKIKHNNGRIYILYEEGNSPIFIYCNIEAPVPKYTPSPKTTPPLIADKGEIVQ
ncbi:hypothetical protein LCGC14_0630130 [marine sediment metagenome]|uniref:Uncharacterized protein n=1 Tax=marine sediment metagenome TaxID=412755 RepID=A0A0F9R7F5_9ZZZZ|nr:hypothetical protein [archaeon]